MKKKGIANILLMLTIVVILTIVIFGVITNFLQTEALQASIAINDETVAITTGAGALTDTPVLTLTYFGNRTLNTSVTGITIGTHVNWTSDGSIVVSQSNFSNGNYEADYTYEPSGYVDNANTRTIVNLVPLMLAVVIFTAVAAFVMVK